MEAEQGMLIRKLSREIPVRYFARGGEFGRLPAFFELVDFREPLEADEIVGLRSQPGQHFVCRALDGTNICAVIAAI